MNIEKKPANARNLRAGDGCADASAFTFTELLAVLAVLTLLAALALPALAGTRFRSQQTVCLNNLSRIGQAFALWGSEHGDRYPITVPWWEGGTARPIYPQGMQPPIGAGAPAWWIIGYQNNAWFQYWWLSNELATPKILVCPSEAGKRITSDFSNNTNGGFLAGGNRNNSVSYPLTHAFSEDGRLFVLGDRNFPYSITSGSGGCGYGFTFNGLLPSIYPDWPWGMTGQQIHPKSGNLLFTDGSAEQTDDAGLKEAMNRSAGKERAVGLGKSGPCLLVPN